MTPIPDPRSYRREIKQLLEKDFVFLLGMPKSGTTWVQNLIDGHPRAICKGEAHFVDMFYLELSRQLDSFNQKVEQQGGIVAHLKKYGGHVETLHYQMVDANYLLVIAVAMMFYRWIEKEDVRVVGEKTPDNIDHLALLSALFPAARFIHVIRDPRDCAVSSWYFQTSNLDRNKRLVQTFDQHILAYAKYWTGKIAAGRMAGLSIGERYIELYYEDLKENTRGQVRKIAQFLDLSTSDNAIAQCLKSGSFEYQSRGRKPGEEDRKMFVRKGVTGDWEHHFSDELNNQFRAIAGTVMKRFGYLT